LTTNETYFFRDEHPFVALKNNVLPELFKLKQKDGVLKHLVISLFNGARAL
jgi:chemotaxis protein methyltransferase CheR